MLARRFRFFRTLRLAVYSGLALLSLLVLVISGRFLPIEAALAVLGFVLLVNTTVVFAVEEMGESL